MLRAATHVLPTTSVVRSGASAAALSCGGLLNSNNNVVTARFSTKRSVFGSPLPDLRIPEESIPSFVLKKLLEHGDRPALTDALVGESYSYSDVVRRSNNVAANLHHRGFKKGDTFTIFVSFLFRFLIRVDGFFFLTS